MRRVVIVTVATMLAASLGDARSFDTGYEPAGLDRLEKEKGTFKTTLIRPDADLSRYTKIQQKQVILVIDTSGAAINEFSTGRLLQKRERETIVPEFDEVVEFKRIVGDALASELGRIDVLERVDGAGPGTLVLQPVVTDVEISASSKNRAEDGRELPELKEGTVVFDLIDGETGEIQARFGERRRCRPPEGAGAEAGAWPYLSIWAEGVAADLSTELERVKAEHTG